MFQNTIEVWKSFYHVTALFLPYFGKFWLIWNHLYSHVFSNIALTPSAICDLGISEYWPGTKVMICQYCSHFIQIRNNYYKITYCWLLFMYVLVDWRARFVDCHQWWVQWHVAGIQFPPGDVTGSCLLAGHHSLLFNGCQSRWKEQQHQQSHGMVLLTSDKANLFAKYLEKLRILI